MPIGNVGGHVPGSEELSKILNGMGVAGASPQTGTDKVVSKSPVNREVKDTVSSYQGEKGTLDWDLEGADNPTLPEPDMQREVSWTNFSIGGDISKAVSLAGIPPVQETLGVAIQSEKMVQLADHHPLARYCLATIGEKEFSQRLEAHFEAVGEPMPQHPASASFREATSEVLEQYLVDTGSFLPDELTLQLEGGMDILKTITNYMTLLEGVNAPEKSFNTGPGLQKTIDMMEENIVLVNTAMEVLKEGQVTGKETLAMADFMKLISDVLTLVKKTLVECQLTDTKKSSEKAQAERDVIRTRIEMSEKKFNEQMSFKGLQSSMDMFNKVMQILMPCLSGVIILFSLAFLPFAPIVTIIMVTVALSMIALQITLTETGAMEDMFDGINGLVGTISTGIFGEDSGDLGTFLVWLTIIITAIVVATLITMCPVVGIAIPAIMTPIISWCVQYSKIGAQIGEFLADKWGIDDDIGEAVLKGVGSMIFSLTTAVCLALASLLREVLTQLIVECVKLIFQIVVELFKMLIGIITIIFQLLVFLIQSGVSLIESIGKGLSQLGTIAIKSITDIIDKIIEAVIAVIAIIVKIINAIMDSIIGAVQSLIDQVVKILTKVFDVIKEAVIKILEGLLQMIIDIFTQILNVAISVIVQTIQTLIQLFVKLFEMIESLIKSLVEELSKMLLNGMSQSLAIIGSLQRAGFKMYEAKVVEIQGALDVILDMLVSCIFVCIMIGKISSHA